MTFRNPLNVLSDLNRRTNGTPSSAFDPSRTGDPIRPVDGRPSIGFGDTHVGNPLVGEPRRRPIGFAPPEDESTERRYRTELSFKRHHEVPRASVTTNESHDGEQTSWQTPGVASVDGDASEPQNEAGQDESATDEKVPFYKREITFRRKRAVPAEVPATLVVDEDEALEVGEQEELPGEVAEDPFVRETLEVLASKEIAVAPETDEPVAWPGENVIEIVAEADVAAEVEPFELPVFEDEVAEAVESLDDPAESLPAVESFDALPTAEPDATSEPEDASDAAEDISAEEMPVSEGKAPRKTKRTSVTL